MCDSNLNKILVICCLTVVIIAIFVVDTARSQNYERYEEDGYNLDNLNSNQEHAAVSLPPAEIDTANENESVVQQQRDAGTTTQGRKKRRRQGRKRKRRPHHVSTTLPTTQQYYADFVTTEAPSVILFDNFYAKQDVESESDVNQAFENYEAAETKVNFKIGPSDDERHNDLGYTTESEETTTYASTSFPPVSPTIVDLKELLKHAGGLSLSEILQQRNLTLGDLLKGKQTAIKALAEPINPPNKDAKNVHHNTILPIRLGHSATGPTKIALFTTKPPSARTSFLKRNKTIDANLNHIPPTIPNIRDSTILQENVQPIKEVISGIRPDLNNSNMKKFTPLFQNRNATKDGIRLPPKWKAMPRRVGTTNADIVTESYDENNPITTEAPESTTQATLTPTSMKLLKNRLTLRQRLKEAQRATTDQKLNTVTESIYKTIETTILPPEESIHEAKQYKYTTMEQLFNFLPQNEIQEPIQRAYIDDTPLDDADVTENNPSLFADITSVRSVDDRTDLLELMEDRRNGARLVKILAQRNMSLDELIDHRARGSSQLHLSEIFFNKTATPQLTPALSPDNMDIVTAFETFPNFSIGSVKSVLPDDIKTDSQGSSYFTSIINIKPTGEVFKEGRAIKIEDALKKETIIPPALPVTPAVATFDDNHFQSDASDTITNSLSRANNKLDYEISGHNFINDDDDNDNTISASVENSPIPVGVRSAIFASLCIVAVCIFIFIMIFGIFRWRQKKKKMISAEEFVANAHPEIFERAISKLQGTGVVYHSSRTHKLNTMDPNSPEVQDYLYDAMRRSQY